MEAQERLTVVLPSIIPMFSWLKPEQRPPGAAASMKRAVILKHMLVKGLATPRDLAVRMATWSEDEQRKFRTEAQSHYEEQIQRLREQGLWDAMERSEQDFMRAGITEVSYQTLVDVSWLAESAVCLLWALGFIDPLPAYDEETNLGVLNRLGTDTFEVLLRNATLRPRDTIEKQRDLAELWHWRARTRQLQEAGDMPRELSGGLTIEAVIRMAAGKAAEDGAFSAPIGDDFPAFGKPYRELDPEEYAIVTSIAQERHRALNWLCGYASGNRWGDTPTDT